MHNNSTNEQKLIDIMFEIALTIHSHKAFDTMSKEDVANWIAKQLYKCGYLIEKTRNGWMLVEIR